MSHLEFTDDGVRTNPNVRTGEGPGEPSEAEISERTGKPKKAPRGKPFQKGQDPRRLQEQQGQGQGQEDGEDEQDEQGEGMGEQEAEQVLDALEGRGQAPQRQQPSPTLSVEDFMREIARQEAGILDADLVQKVIPVLGGMAAEVEKAQKLARRALKQGGQGGQGGTFRVELVTATAPKVREISGVQHAAFGTVMGRLEVGFRNFLLVGPAGSGKTTLGSQVADALERPFASVSCSAGMSEGVLLGRLLPTGEAGRFEYSAAPFVEMYEQGGVFLLDEVDAADANVLLVLNSALANGHLDVPNRLDKPVAKRHPDFVLLAAGNTYGQGANRMYVGRNQLDAAFLSRFAGTVIEMGYDLKAEDALTKALGEALKLAPSTVTNFVTAFRTIRGKVEQAGLRRVWGMREMLAGVRLMGATGATVPGTVQVLMAGWTEDERTRAGAK